MESKDIADLIIRQLKCFNGLDHFFDDIWPEDAEVIRDCIAKVIDDNG